MTVGGIMTKENRVYKSHMPGDSFWFEKVIPVSLIVMAIIMVGLILFAAGVLLGIVKF